MAEEDVGSTASTSLDGRFSIDPGAPLEIFDSPAAPAYAAEGSRGGRDQYFALICDPRTHVRHDIIDPLRSVNNPHFLRPVDGGVIKWPPAKAKRFAILFEQPAGSRVMESPSQPIPPWDVEQATKWLLKPAVSVLRELAQKGITHRAIRPNNIFFHRGNRGPIVLGECLTGAPGEYQAAFMETIESGMCNAGGRGEGTVQDDLYALGITMLTLLFGRSPAAGMSAEKLIARRINNGSYNTLVGNYRMPAEAVEPLRGLISDDPKERWNLRELDLWLSGRRLSPKQVKLPPRASRPLTFENEDHFNVRSLAFGLSKGWSKALTVIRSSNFENWLRRTLAADELLDQLTKAIGPAGASGDGERTVARACMVLDPMAPLRYKDVSANLDGLGPLVAEGLGDNALRQSIQDIIRFRLAGAWLSYHGNIGDVMKITGLFDKLVDYVGNATPGFGFERCLYELNQWMCCRSPVLEPYYVMEMKQVLPALEEAAEKVDQDINPVDRHLAAFIAARSRAVSESWLKALSHPPNSIDYLVGSVRLLALLQQTEHKEALPNLTGWMAHLLEDAVTSFKNQRKQKQLRKDMTKATKSGNIIELLRLFDDISAQEKDRKGFEQARTNYLKTSQQIAILANDNASRDAIAQAMGEQVAAVTSGGLASVSILGIVLYQLW